MEAQRGRKMDTLVNALAYIGALESCLFIVGIIYAVALWANGVLPALLRLGNGLAKRKIALFAKGDNVPVLRTCSWIRNYSRRRTSAK